MPSLHFTIHTSFFFLIHTSFYSLFKNSFSKNVRAPIVFSMSRGSALWEEKGPPSILSPCPRSDQWARLDVIFISQLRVASSITKASGRLQELLPSGDFIFFPAHQSQKRRAQAADRGCVSISQLAACALLQYY